MACMSDARASGLALILGTAGLIITMAFHPTGHDLFGEDAERGARAAVATHALAMLALPVLFFGALGLVRVVARTPLAVLGLVLYGAAASAGLAAATASGLVGPRLAHDDTASNGWEAAYRLNGHVNQANAQVLVIGSSLALLCWSLALLRRGRFFAALGLYGCVLATATIALVLAGHVRLDVHGFGAIVLGQSLWFAGAGARLLRDRTR